MNLNIKLKECELDYIVHTFLFFLIQEFHKIILQYCFGKVKNEEGYKK